MTMQELCAKDVIQLGSGLKLGRVDDLEFDEHTACIRGLILRGRPHMFGLLGRDEDVTICWQNIHAIGLDVILVKTQFPVTMQKPHRSILGIFHNFVRE